MRSNRLLSESAASDNYIFVSHHVRSKQAGRLTLPTYVLPGHSAAAQPSVSVQLLHALANRHQILATFPTSGYDLRLGAGSAESAWCVHPWMPLLPCVCTWGCGVSSS